MACREAHYGFPHSWRVIVLNVIVDQARVSCRCVEAFSQILKKDPHQHCTDGHANDRQTIACLRLVGSAISHWDSVRRHSQPRQGCYTRLEYSIGPNHLAESLIFDECFHSSDSLS